MPRHLDWYSVELERMLKGQLPAAELAETLGEVEAHLTDSARDLEPTCQHGEDADALAVERFGPPRRVAFDLVSAHHEPPYWHTGRWLILWLVIFLLCAVAPAGGKGGPFGLGVLVGLIGLAYVSVRARRMRVAAVTWLAGGVFVLAAIVLPFFVVWIGPEAVPLGGFGDRIDGLTRSAASANKFVGFLDRGIAAFSQNDPKAIPSEFRLGKAYLAYPRFVASWSDRYGPMLGPVDHDTRSVSAEVSFSEAQRWWRRSAGTMKSDLEGRVRFLPARIAALRAAQDAGYLVCWWRDLPIALLAAGFVWVYGMFLHGAFVLIGRIWLNAKLMRRQYA